MTEVGYVSLEKIVGSIESLVKIADTIINPEVAIYFARINMYIKPALTEYNQEINTLFSHYAEINPKTGKLELSSEDKIELFNKEKENYMKSIGVDLSIINKISYKLLDGIKQSCFNSLLWCIE